MDPVITFVFVLIIGVVLMGMWYAAYTRKAELTGLSTREVSKLMKTQEEIAEGIVELRAKVAAIEKLLREVG